MEPRRIYHEYELLGISVLKENHGAQLALSLICRAQQPLVQAFPLSRTSMTGSVLELDCFLAGLWTEFALPVAKQS